MREDPGKHRKTDVTVLYEDPQLLVCVKPRGVLSAKDASGKRSMEDLLTPRSLYPVHRLDREVGGLMVFAKTSAAAAFLCGQMGSGFEKEYLAHCEGQPPSEGSLTDLLYHDRQRNKTYVVRRKRAGVKEARLSYRVLSREESGAVLLVRLHTGRTHQIRVQFASRGYPLMGDRAYGAQSRGEIRLLSYRLRFPHPDGNIMDFTLPEKFFL